MKTNILIIGSGAREHALGWKLAQSPDCGRLYFAPGNGGTASLGCNIDIPMTEVSLLVDFAQKNDCFTVVGSELPLSLGVTDALRARGLRVFGPSKEAARLETSKAYAKDFMRKYNIPAAPSESFDNPEMAIQALSTRSYPVWVKADGLAAGKGAVFCRDEAEAMQVIESMMYDKAFGSAGDRIVLEDHMVCRETTLMCLTDGKTIMPLESARDYKRIYDQDKGANTGGMGCISPVPGYMAGGVDTIIRRALQGIQCQDLDYRGLLYIELAMTAQGPKVIEFNARFGDPETQALMLRLDTDLLSILQAVEERRLNEVLLTWKPETAVGIVLSSGGYPGGYETGHPITELPPTDEGEAIFHAGTAQRDGELVTAGGRVLTVTALGRNAEEARQNAYKMTAQVKFKDSYYRKDIGKID